MVWVVTSLFTHHWTILPYRLIQPIYIAMGIVTAILAKPTRMQKRASRALAQCDAIEAIGPLVEALGYQDRRMRPDIVKALTRLLPRLKASDARLLNAEQKSILNRALATGDTYTESDFLVAIIQALGQVGGQESVSQVQRWASSYFVSSPGGLRVLEAACACLPALQARAEIERVSGTLLRPSHQPETGPNALLRPSTGRSENAPEQLLRASLQEDANAGAGGGRPAAEDRA
ncbi:MAG TPA: hypothetical protein VKT32_01855 [Chthonomonadaceae bacterium]|nr:hypothetical protein [Chthonomonadaceae bacterium]